MNTRLRCLITAILLLLITNLTFGQNKILVFQSDFGLKDGAVSAMKGVAIGVSPDLKIFDLRTRSLHIISGRLPTAWCRQFLITLQVRYSFL